MGVREEGSVLEKEGPTAKHRGTDPTSVTWSFPMCDLSWSWGSGPLYGSHAHPCNSWSHPPYPEPFPELTGERQINAQGMEQLLARRS